MTIYNLLLNAPNYGGTSLCKAKPFFHCCICVWFIFVFLIYISESSVIFLKLASSLQGVLFLPLDAVIGAIL